MMKILLLCLLIAFVIGGGIFFLTRQGANIKSGPLSERSKAYIEEKKKESGSDWRFARLDNTEDKAGAFIGKRIDVGDCLSFVMVFRVTNPRQEGECDWYFGIDKPKGFMTVYMVEVTVNNPDQIDGVSMRQKFTDKYEEEKKTINGVNYLIFRGESGVYEANAFALNNGKALTFNIITQSTENFDEQLEAMLKTIEFK